MEPDFEGLKLMINRYNSLDMAKYIYNSRAALTEDQVWELFILMWEKFSKRERKSLEHSSISKNKSFLLKVFNLRRILPLEIFHQLIIFKLEYDFLVILLEKGKPTYLYPIYSNRDGSKLYCPNSFGSSRVELPVGIKCTLTTRMYGLNCERCFDDKEKTPQFYIYFQTLPIIENKIINLTIY